MEQTRQEREDKIIEVLEKFIYTYSIPTYVHTLQGGKSMHTVGNMHIHI